MIRAVPESIPDVSLSNYPLLGPKNSDRLRDEQHNKMVTDRRCHSYEGLEYHFCGRREGRLFPLAELG